MADANRKSLLFVTKDEDLKEKVTEDLEGNNHRVVLASNDSEARLKVVGEKFQFVIVDLDMPDFKSESFIQNIRHKEKLKGETDSLPIIIFGESEESFEDICSEFEKVSFLSKPLDYTELKTKLAVLGGSSAVKENSRPIIKGTILIEEGTASNEMYWVMTGSFVTTIKEGENEKVIGEVKQGELIGEMSFLDSKPRSASVTALEDSEVLVIPHKKFIHAMDGQPQWFQTLMRTLSARLRNSNDIISGKGEILDTIDELQKDLDKFKAES